MAPLVWWLALVPIVVGVKNRRRPAICWRLMLQGQPARRHTHRMLAMAFLLFRLDNLGTSLVLPPEHPLTEMALHR